MAYDLTEFCGWILDRFERDVRFGRGAGQYGGYVGDHEPNLYGTADMACILYTLGALDPSERQRTEWLRRLQSFQDPCSGYFVSRTARLGKVHNTAFALGAMRLFDKALTVGKWPAHPLRFASAYRTPGEMESYVRTLDWHSAVYPAGEDVVGLASAFFNVRGTVKPSWFRWLLDFFDAHLFDSTSGMVGRCKPPSGDLDQIGGTFHFAFLWRQFKRAMPFPRQRVDAILALQRPNGLWSEDNPWWLTLDALYMLVDVALQSTYRQSDVRRAVETSVALCYERAMDRSGREESFCSPELGVHTLTGAVSLFAVAQGFLGTDVIVSKKPLRLVLDKRPYI